LGEEMEAVERREAAMVRRICDSDLSVSMVTQATSRTKLVSPSSTQLARCHV
jgi:hypothetical protein